MSINLNGDRALNSLERQFQNNTQITSQAPTQNVQLVKIFARNKK
jgi:hypothetical protein